MIKWLKEKIFNSEKKTGELDLLENRKEYLASMNEGTTKEFYDQVSEENLNNHFMNVVELQYLKEERENSPQPLKMTDAAFNYYKNSVKGNKHISYEQACLKMTRNMMLALPVNKKNGRIIYMYGTLHFSIKNGRVSWIMNNRPIPAVWYKDRVRYDEITKMLGIID